MTIPNWKTQWATSLFDLFAEPKLRSKYLLKSKKWSDFLFCGD